ncbi:hypothetical protein CCHR01_15959 [Colletotrichum chrysophilum]|uniref:Uncharacterized protein n=1 Tax=Colletotrichum chrysophilum TaxID=1836956 RepID=A0AAD9EE06_9PEZI|nr:hypothetical protein CCHR01_15959 [Colletotrichum chrysophilum]
MTYNNRHSPVVTDPTTTLSLIGLSVGERTGSRVFQWVWSYVEGGFAESHYTLYPQSQPLAAGRSGDLMQHPCGACRLPEPDNAVSKHCQTDSPYRIFF